MIRLIPGSYAGHTAANVLASALRKGHRVVLVDANDFVVHMPYVARSTVTGDVRTAPLRTEAVFQASMGPHVFVHARVTSISEGEVELDTEFEGSRHLPFAACILAVGSGGPGKPELGITLEAYEQRQRDSAQAIKDADEVNVAGGGPVGVAVAGEIARTYPSKRLVLVHCRQYLAYTQRDGESHQLSEQQKALSERLFGQLCARGVWIHRNERMSADGKMLGIVGNPVYGHVVWCTGLQPSERTAFLDPKLLAGDGHVIVDDSLRTMLENVYAIGDCADTDERKTIAQAVRQGEECARIVLAHLSGKKAKYVAIESETFCIPLGPKGGVYPRAVEGYQDGSGAGVIDLGWIGGVRDAPDWYLRNMYPNYSYHCAFRSLFMGSEPIP